MPNPLNQVFSQPLYIQVCELLKSRIASGQWRPGEIIPNEISLAEEFGISIGTLRKALRILEEQSVVVRRQGRGTFVRDFTKEPISFSSITDCDGRKLIDQVRVHAVKNVGADEKIAKKLEIAISEKVMMISRDRYRGRRTYMFEDCWLPERRFKSLPANMTTLELPTLAQLNHILIGRGEEKVRAVSASAQHTERLGVVEGTPILELERVVFSDKGDPLEWRVAYCNLKDEEFLIRYR